MIIQPFRENRVSGVCCKCGDAIFSGDLAYGIGGETLCMKCVEDSAFITSATEKQENICLDTAFEDHENDL